MGLILIQFDSVYCLRLPLSVIISNYIDLGALGKASIVNILNLLNFTIIWTSKITVYQNRTLLCLQNTIQNLWATSNRHLVLGSWIIVTLRRCLHSSGQLLIYLLNRVLMNGFSNQVFSSISLYFSPVLLIKMERN